MYKSEYLTIHSFVADGTAVCHTPERAISFPSLTYSFSELISVETAPFIRPTSSRNIKLLRLTYLSVSAA